MFYFTLYSLGLRLGEGLRLQVGDIDAARQRVPIRDAKGRKDRLVPLPGATLACLRLHPNSKRMIRLLQWLLKLDPNRALAWVKKRPSLKCPWCGTAMRIVQTRLPPLPVSPDSPDVVLGSWCAKHLQPAGIICYSVAEC